MGGEGRSMLKGGLGGWLGPKARGGGAVQEALGYGVWPVAGCGRDRRPF